MLPKKNRANKKALEIVFKKGEFINSPNLTLKFILNTNLLSPRISSIIPKTVATKATKRNFLRRCVYIVLKKHINKLPAGFLGALIFNKKNPDFFCRYKNKTKNLVFILNNEIKDIFQKI